MKQIFLLFLLAVVTIVVAGWLTNPGSLGNFLKGIPQTEKQSTVEEKPKIKIKNQEITIDVARTEEERRIGLSKYETIAPDFGMLFVVPQNSKPKFWMKGMKFPIDIIWIDDGKIVKINDNVPILKRNLQDTQIPTYAPDNPVDFVLEIAAGTAKKRNFVVGDDIFIPSSIKPLPPE